MYLITQPGNDPFRADKLRMLIDAFRMQAKQSTELADALQQVLNERDMLQKTVNSMSIDQGKLIDERHDLYQFIAQRFGEMPVMEPQEVAKKLADEVGGIASPMVPWRYTLDDR